jgi:tetratricopeptide (TPR) repeat protein
VLNTVLEKGKAPAGTTQIQTNNFSGPMYFSNFSLIERQYQQNTGQPLKDQDLKKRIEDAGKLAAAHNFAAAASLLARVAESAPVAAVYNNLGVAYANSHDLAHAEEAFRNAVGKDPDYQAAWVNLGLVQKKAGKLPAAIESFRRAPDQAQAAQQIKSAGDELSGHDILTAKSIASETAVPDVIASGHANYFRLVASPKYRDLVTVSMTNRSTTLQPWLNVFGPDKADIGGNRYLNTSGADLAYSFVAEPGSTYYLSVRGYDNTAGEYILTVKPAKVYDRYEPNDDILHASEMAVDRPVDASVLGRADADYYRFTSPSRAGNIEVSIANRSTTLEPWLNVFGPDKADISGNRYLNTSGADLKYSFAAQPNTTYYLDVHGYDGTAGEYTLTVRPQ